MNYNKLYYLIQKDGSAVFSLPYGIEFLTHCLIVLENRGINTTEYSFLNWEMSVRTRFVGADKIASLDKRSAVD